MAPRWAGAAPLVLATSLSLAACTDDEGSSPSPVPTDAVILETTTSTTEAPITGVPLVVVDQGVSSFADPFDPNATLGGYGVIVENPNAEAMAAGVHISTRILDPAGTELLVDRTLLNAVMPGSRMAVGRTLIEPIEEPAQLEVTVEVTAWLRPSSSDAAMTVEGIVTEPEANGGAVTRFTVASSWPQPEEGVDATAVYRAEDGRILAAESTTLASVPPQADTPAQIRLLSPIPSLAATEVYVGRGIAAQTAG